MSQEQEEIAKGWAEAREGHCDAAETRIQRVLEGGERSANALRLLAFLKTAKAQPQEAAPLLEEALQKTPGDGSLWLELSAALSGAQREADALKAARRACRASPEWAPCWLFLGSLLSSHERHEEAIGALRRAIELDPRNAEGHHRLGLAFDALDDPSRAAESYERAIECAPNHLRAHYNLARIHLDNHRLEEAESALRRALELDPNHPQAGYSLAQLLYQRGAFADGYELFEKRWLCPGIEPLNTTAPVWTGGPLRGRSLLVVAEQGLGDTVMMARFLPRLAESAGRIICQCQPAITALLEESFPEITIVPHGEEAPPHDLLIPTMSLPAACRCDEESIPDPSPYLHGPQERRERWREALSADDRPRIALHWQGNPSYRHDRRRSFPLAAMAPLGSLDGIRFLSLQKGDGAQQLATPPFEIEVIQNLDQEGAFLDSLAILSEIDLLITSDSAIAHVAGAAACPTWLALGRAPEWRWFLEREGSPWYRSLRLWRRSEAEEWRQLFDRMRASLQAAPLRRGSTPPAMSAQVPER